MIAQYYVGVSPDEDAICHYGVLGMKWGVHRQVRRETSGYRAKYKRAKKQYKLAKSMAREIKDNPYQTRKQAKIAKKQAKIAKQEMREMKAGYRDYKQRVKENAQKVMNEQLRNEKRNKRFKEVENARLNRNKNDRSDRMVSDEWTRALDVAERAVHNTIVNPKGGKINDKKMHDAQSLENAIREEHIKPGRDYIVERMDSKHNIKGKTYTDRIVANPESKRMQRYMDIINDMDYSTSTRTTGHFKKY